MAHSPDITHPLQPFARSDEGLVRALAASAERTGEGAFRFRYLLDVDWNPLRVRIPLLRPHRQADELWKHTCFEAFIACPSLSDEYLELNFSPSTEWAAYAFRSYRKGMAPVALSCAPRIELSARAGSPLTLEALVDAHGVVPESWRGTAATLRIALSAVIEDTNGRISYWALKHAPDKPDFHHAAGFILEV